MRLSRSVVGVLASVLVAALLLGYAAAQERPAEPQKPEAAAAQEPVRAYDVVIVWSGGPPDAPALPAPEAGAVDAVTQATPAAGNVKEIAAKLGKELEAAGHSVLVIAAEDCRDPRLIIRAKGLVLGCPEYFGLPPWQMVRFFDETLYRIYRSQTRLGDHVVTAFSTGGRCLNVLNGVLRSTQGKAVEGTVISARGTSEADREILVKQLAERVAAGL